MSGICICIMHRTTEAKNIFPICVVVRVTYWQHSITWRAVWIECEHVVNLCMCHIRNRKGWMIIQHALCSKLRVIASIRHELNIEMSIVKAINLSLAVICKERNFPWSIHFRNVSNSIHKIAKAESNDFHGRRRNPSAIYKFGDGYPPYMHVTSLVFYRIYAISRIIAKQHSSVLYHNTSIFISSFLFVFFFALWLAIGGRQKARAHCSVVWMRKTAGSVRQFALCSENDSWVHMSVCVWMWRIFIDGNRYLHKNKYWEQYLAEKSEQWRNKRAFVCVNGI